MTTRVVEARDVRVGPAGLEGVLRIPARPSGLILFVHGSGSSRFSPRNTLVAGELGRRGLATLLFDLLSPEESIDRRNVFDVPLLGARTIAAVDWAGGESPIAALPLALFGASTGAAAALLAAAMRPERIAAVVSRGGRPDLAESHLAQVRAPTLLIVGGGDEVVLELNQRASRRLACEHELAVVAGATHLFEEPGTLEQVVELAAAWFLRHMVGGEARA